MQTFKAAAAYFGLVFGAGFVLGTLRVLWAVPRFGERTAELAEMPVMLLVTALAARWVVRHFNLAGRGGISLRVGFAALGLLLAAEFAMVALVSGQPLSEYVRSRDTVSGAVYLALLVVFAFMPRLFAGLPRH